MMQKIREKLRGLASNTRRQLGFCFFSSSKGYFLIITVHDYRYKDR